MLAPEHLITVRPRIIGLRFNGFRDLTDSASGPVKSDKSRSDTVLLLYLIDSNKYCNQCLNYSLHCFTLL